MCIKSVAVVTFSSSGLTSFQRVLVKVVMKGCICIGKMAKKVSKVSQVEIKKDTFTDIRNYCSCIKFHGIPI